MYLSSPPAAALQLYRYHVVDLVLEEITRDTLCLSKICSLPSIECTQKNLSFSAFCSAYLGTNIATININIAVISYEFLTGF